jgi:hypothetical protein
MLAAHVEDDTRDLTPETRATREAPSPTPAMVELVVLAGPDQGRRCSLEGPGPARLLIGKGDTCHLRLADPHVSRRHAAIHLAAAPRVRVRDLGSTNGTFVSGVRVADAFLIGGEIIRIGNTVLRVKTAFGDPAQDEPPPSSPTVDDFLQSVLERDLPLSHARQEVLDEFYRRYVGRVVAQHGGNITRAAAASGLAHRYFQSLRARGRSSKDDE